MRLLFWLLLALGFYLAPVALADKLVSGAQAPDGTVFTLYLHETPPDTVSFVVKSSLANGEPNLAFGPGGEQAFAHPGVSRTVGQELTVGPDGTVAIAGNLVAWPRDSTLPPGTGPVRRAIGRRNAPTEIFLLKLRPNGKPIPDAQGSLWTIPVRALNIEEEVSSVAMDARGNVAIAFKIDPRTASGPKAMGFIKVLPSGAIDTTFGQKNGLAKYRASQLSVGSGYIEVVDLKLEEDGKMTFAVIGTLPHGNRQDRLGAMELSSDGKEYKPIGVQTILRRYIGDSDNWGIAVDAKNRRLAVVAPLKGGDKLGMEVFSLDTGERDPQFGVQVLNLTPRRPAQAPRTVRFTAEGKFLVVAGGKVEGAPVGYAVVSDPSTAPIQEIGLRFSPDGGCDFRDLRL